MKPVYQHALGISLVCLSVGWLFLLPFFPLHSDRRVPADLLPENQQAEALVFFGYAGCPSICPPSLQAMAEIADARPDWQLTFINLDGTSDLAVTAAYARGFHPDFLSYAPQPERLRQLMRAFGASIVGETEQEIFHSGYIYWLRREEADWVIEQIFRDGDELTQRFVEPR